MKNKKILVNTFPLKDGGGQTHILKIIEYFKDEKFLEIIILKSKFSNLNFKKSRVKLHETTFPVNNPILRVFYEIFIFQFYYLKMKLMCFFVREEFQYLGLPKIVRK